MAFGFRWLPDTPGPIYLLDDVFWWFSFDTLWPLFIIGIGLLIVTNAMQKRR